MLLSVVDAGVARPLSITVSACLHASPTYSEGAEVAKSDMCYGVDGILRFIATVIADAI